MIIIDNFCQFWMKSYVVTSHLNRLGETVQMRGHNIWFRWEIKRIIISCTPSYIELCICCRCCRRSERVIMDTVSYEHAHGKMGENEAQNFIRKNTEYNKILRILVLFFF